MQNILTLKGTKYSEACLKLELDNELISIRVEGIEGLAQT